MHLSVLYSIAQRLSFSILNFVFLPSSLDEQVFSGHSHDPGSNSVLILRSLDLAAALLRFVPKFMVGNELKDCLVSPSKVKIFLTFSNEYRSNL